MGNKINVSELLKDCPKDMELDCVMYEDVYFDHVDELNIIHCYIQNEGFKTSITFNQHGTPHSDVKSKCVIFPKGKNTWEGFQRPFKDGDIIYNRFRKKICIYYLFEDQVPRIKGCRYNESNSHQFEKLEYPIPIAIQDYRLATEEEKEELFNAINDNGYCWNDESKTLEKLIKPKPKPCFKSGDTIRHKKNKTIIKTIGYVDKDNYVLYNGHILFFSEQDQYELIPNKFDISKLKPFDEVLVRDFDSEVWEIDFFSKLLDEKHFKCHGSSYVQCIPYKGNEHLHNTTNACHPFYKTWKK